MKFSASEAAYNFGVFLLRKFSKIAINAPSRRDKIIRREVNGKTATRIDALNW